MPTRRSRTSRRSKPSRRRDHQELERLKREQNTSGDEIAQAKRQGQDTTAIQEAAARARSRSSSSTSSSTSIEHQWTAALLALPNLPHASVPVGKAADENLEVRRDGEPRAFDFAPKAHWDLGPELGILDFERATKIAGARFSVLSGAGRAAVSRADQLHARPSHARSRLPRGGAAVPGELPRR